MQSKPKRVLVIGGNGQMGQLFARKLVEEGALVTTADLATSAAVGNAASIVSDVLSFTAELRASLREAELVLVCLPEPTALSACTAILSEMRPGALWVDTLSVKTAIHSALAKSAHAVEALSVNPMCSPSLGFDGQNVAVVPIRSGSRSAAFLKMLAAWGARLSLLSAEEHDRMAAMVQAATHAAVLAFGVALTRMNYDFCKAALVSTPPHRLLMALLGRMLSGGRQTYWDVQAGNPYASEARRHIAAALIELEAAVNLPNAERFGALCKQIETMLGAGSEALAALCASLFRHVQEVGRPLGAGSETVQRMCRPQKH